MAMILCRPASTSPPYQLTGGLPVVMAGTGEPADALITLDRQLAHAVKDLVTVAPIEALY